MNKQIQFFIAVLLASLSTTAQDLRIIYNLNGCPSNPLAGQSAIYVFPTVATSGPSGQNEYFGGFAANPPTQLPMNNTGGSIWEVCLNPYTFTDANGLTVPLSSTIFNIRLQFHNQSLSILTGDCQGSQLQIDNPMTPTPTSSNPAIVNSLRNCFVGIEAVDNSSNTVYLSPNPVKANATFFLNLTNSGDVEIEIYNMLGRKIKSIVAQNQRAGAHKIDFDITDGKGFKLSNGYYFYTFKLNDQEVKTGKIVITQ